MKEIPVRNTPDNRTFMLTDLENGMAIVPAPWDRIDRVSIDESGKVTVMLTKGVEPSTPSWLRRLLERVVP